MAKQYAHGAAYNGPHRLELGALGFEIAQQGHGGPQLIAEACYGRRLTGIRAVLPAAARHDRFGIGGQRGKGALGIVHLDTEIARRFGQLRLFERGDHGKGASAIFVFEVDIKDGFAGQNIGEVLKAGLDVLEPLTRGIADLERHHGAADLADDLPGQPAGFGAAIDSRGALVFEGAQCGGQATGKIGQGMGVGALEAVALADGGIHLDDKLAIDLRKFLERAGGGFGKRGDIGGEHVEIVGILGDARGGHARIYRDDTHHLDGPLQIGNRQIGGADHLEQAFKIGPFLRKGAR